MSKTTMFPNYDVVVDWLEFTIKTKSVFEILYDWGFEFSKVHMFNSGFLHYDMTYVYGEKIKFLVNSKDLYHAFYNPLDESEQNHELWLHRDYDNTMGVHVLLSGYACREIEGKIIWSELLTYVHDYAKNVSRIDFAFDVFDKSKLSLETVRWYLKRGLMVSKARYSIETLKRDNATGEIVGQSVRIGSSASETMIMIYDKLQERESANYIVDESINAWNRLELRLRRSAAENLLKVWKQTEYLSKKYQDKNVYTDPVELAIFSLNNLLSFKDPKHKVKNTTERRNATWWNEFINTSEKLRLSNKSIQASIQRKKNWIQNSTLKSLAMVFVADMDDINMTDPQKFITDGLEKINSYNLQMINNYRLKRGASVISQNDLDSIREKINLDLVDNC